MVRGHALSRADLARAGIDEDGDLVWALVRLALSSRARISILPMQDVLELGAEARMNRPGTFGGGNWEWRLQPGQTSHAAAERLREATAASHRLAPVTRHALAATGLLAQQPRYFERHAGAGQAAERIGVAWQARMDMDVSAWQAVCEFVVVCDDQFQSQAAGFLGLKAARDAAVHGHHERCAGGGELAKRLAVETISLVQPMRDVEIDIRPQVRERLQESGSVLESKAEPGFEL